MYLFMFWQIDVGLMVGNSQVIFEKAENSSLTLVGTLVLSFIRQLNLLQEIPLIYFNCLVWNSLDNLFIITGFYINIF